MNGIPKTVNRVLAAISENFPRSAIPVNRVSKGACSQQGLDTSYTSGLAITRLTSLEI